MPNDLLLRIQKLYGDFLYEKQENEASIDIYIKCLDLFEKLVDSQGESVDQEDDLDDFVMTVITKFKDAANIPNLTKFLFKLYELKEANNDHITLLLCCYCKLKMTEELDKFINDLDLDEDNNLQDLNFQLIINLFKECGYFTQVIRLLFRLNQPNLIVGIQLNDLKQPRNSLNYIKSLPIDELLLILTEHSKTFLDDCPIAVSYTHLDVYKRQGIYSTYSLCERHFKNYFMLQRKLPGNGPVGGARFQLNGCSTVPKPNLVRVLAGVLTMAKYGSIIVRSQTADRNTCACVSVLFRACSEPRLQDV